MSEQTYFLMHRDDIAATVTIDDLTGTMLKVSPKNQTELIPLRYIGKTIKALKQERT